MTVVPITRFDSTATILEMKSRNLFPAAILAVILLSANLFAQAGRRAAPPPKTVDQCVLREPIHGDLTAQVAKFKMVSMPFSVTGLNEQEQKMVYKLVEAARYLDNIYW